MNLSGLPELAVPAEVARALRCSTRFVQAECAAGRLGARKIAGRFLVAREDVQSYLEQMKVNETCQKETRERDSTGEKTEMSGKSSGMKRDANAANLRLQMIMEKQRGNSQNSLPVASVIHLSAAHKGQKKG